MLNNNKRLDVKAALITDATVGIEEATAKRFLEEGASVMLARRSLDKLKKKRKRLSGFDNIADFVVDALELLTSNIRFNAICPGAGHDFFLSFIPIGRYGTNEEAVNLSLILASNESTYRRDVIHMIDGGFIAG